MKSILITFCVLFSLSAFASGSQHDDHAHHDHDNLDAHNHGEVKLLMVVEKNIVDIMMEGSADSFIGFEHRPNPKNKKEVAVFEKFYEAWTKKNSEIFVFPKKFGCKVKGANLSWKGKGKHKNINLAAKYMCVPPVAGTEVTMKFLPHFERVTKLEIDVLPLKDMPYTKEVKNLKKAKEFKLKL